MDCYDESKMVDHANSNILDNRTENLSISDAEHNAQNRSSGKNSSSKYVGVAYLKPSSRWLAYLQYKGIKNYLGTHATELEAAKARDKKALEFNTLFKTIFKLNLPT